MNVGVLVTTHDGYSDIWPILAELFRRFWPDRPWPLYWMSNGHAVPEGANAIVSPAIERKDWGHNVAAAVERMPEDLILFWVEEILPLSRIPTSVFLEAADLLDSLPDVGIVQLTRYYVRTETATIGNFTDYPRSAFGFSAALPAIFRRNVLLHLLRTLSDSRDFELESATVMLRDLPDVRSLTPCRPMFRLCDNALIKGPWCQCMPNHIRELGLDLDLSRRGFSPLECLHMDGVPA